MIGKRDRALLALGFAGAFRRSELCALEVADLVGEPGHRAVSGQLRDRPTDAPVTGARGSATPVTTVGATPIDARGPGVAHPRLRRCVPLSELAALRVRGSQSARSQGSGQGRALRRPELVLLGGPDRDGRAAGRSPPQQDRPGRVGGPNVRQGPRTIPACRASPRRPPSRCRDAGGGHAGWPQTQRRGW